MLWARIERKATGSKMNYKLPYRMEYIEIEEWLKKHMVGWLALSVAITLEALDKK